MEAEYKELGNIGCCSNFTNTVTVGPDFLQLVLGKYFFQIVYKFDGK